MVTSLVQFKLPHPITPQEARQRFASTAPQYQTVPGLIRKYYLLAEDGVTAGGFYTWASRADAERLYTDEWRNFVKSKYGCEPSVTFFETPVMIDNVQQEVVVGP